MTANTDTNKTLYKGLNPYTKAYLMSVLVQDGIKIEKDVPADTFTTIINVKYNNTLIYTYIKGQQGHSIVVDGNVVAQMPVPVNNDMQEVLDMLSGANVLRKRKEMRLEDVRATAYIAKVLQQNQK